MFLFKQKKGDDSDSDSESSSAERFFWDLFQFPDYFNSNNNGKNFTLEIKGPCDGCSFSLSWLVPSDNSTRNTN